MTIDEGGGHTRYRCALLTNASDFGLEVLRKLLEQDYPPELVILPEYPPAPEITQLELGIETATISRHRVLNLEPSLELGYAPSAWQQQCGSLLRQRGIDFILVACWPYLIDAVLIESASSAALNLHPSMLPRYRGPDPLALQLADGNRRFGVSLHLLSQRFDRGDIVLQSQLDEVCAEPDREWLQNSCAQLGCSLFIEALNSYDAGWNLTRQDD